MTKQFIFYNNEIKKLGLKNKITKKDQARLYEIIKLNFRIVEDLKLENLSEIEKIRLCLIFKIRNAGIVLAMEKALSKQYSNLEELFQDGQELLNRKIPPPEKRYFGNTFYGVFKNITF